jgi:hypothetical protein
MALAQTSLDLNILTVATLYNRGSPLSSSVSYVPVVSSIGAFSRWTNEPVGALFVSQFYTYSNGEFFMNYISSIQEVNSRISSSLHLNTDNLSSAVSTSYSQLLVASNIGFSTLSSFNELLLLNSTSISTIYSSINSYFSSITPGISTTQSIFYDTLFSPQASTLIEQGIYYYINRDSIGDYTRSIENPNPILNGDFGSNIPLPWYWSNAAPRYIGPGISSIVTIFNDTVDYPFFNNINDNFPSTLSSISTGIYYSNVSLDIYRSNIISTVATAANFIDGGSSISTLYADFSSTFLSTLDYASTFGPILSTYSTFLIDNLSTGSTIPTVDGATIPFYISAGNTLLNANQNQLNSTLYNTISQPNILIQPYTVFSTIVQCTISTGIAELQSLDCFPGLYKISTILQSTFIPFYSKLDVSTNYLGYFTISTLGANVFSTFSTGLPYLLGRDTLSSLSTLNSRISTLSTAITRDASTIYSVVPPYITAPGISSMTAEFSTNLSVTYKDYSNTISTIIRPFNAAFFNVNPVAGLCTIRSDAFILNSTIIRDLCTVTAYVSSGFNREYLQIQSTNKSIISQLSVNVINFISAGISSYNVSYSTFGYVSSLPFQYTQYISSQTNTDTGALYTNLANLSSLESSFLTKLDPFIGSTVYYKMLPIISDYSTSLFLKGDIIPRYKSRSTFFTHVSSLSSLNCWFSSPIVQEVGIQTSVSNKYNFNLQGSASIIPRNVNPVITPSLLLPNIQIYATDKSNPIYSMQTINVSSSTISFNSSNFVIKWLYDYKNYAHIGINTSVDPIYSLDIGVGDARKPTGVTWITASDARVKENILDACYKNITEQISSLRLVSYTWEESYRSSRHLPLNRTLGFLSQEVERVFPSSVSEMAEYGFPDFKSLDTDQLYMAKFALTQNLIKRVESLKLRLNALMKES